LSRVAFCRSVSFRAKHHYALPGASPEENRRRFGEACEPHDHRWTLTIWLEGPPDPQTGMVADLTHVDAVLREEALDRFDGGAINADPYFARRQPATETLAVFFAEKLAPRFPGLVLAKVRVAECDDIFAEWRP